MPAQSLTELQSFHEFVARQLASDAHGGLTVEETLDRWRAEQTNLAAIREGLADIAAGRTRPCADVLCDLRDELRSA